MTRRIVAALTLAVLLTAGGCQDSNPEREKARQDCADSGGVFADSEADDGSPVWSCVL